MQETSKRKDKKEGIKNKFTFYLQNENASPSCLYWYNFSNIHTPVRDNLHFKEDLT